jgi:hypothetical protein
MEIVCQVRKRQNLFRKQGLAFCIAIDDTSVLPIPSEFKDILIRQ